MAPRLADVNLVATLLVAGVILASAQNFYLQNVFLSDRCVDVSGTPGTTDGDNIQTYGCEFGVTNTDQIWNIDVNGQLRSTASNRCMDCEGDQEIDDGVNVQLYTCEDPSYKDIDQRWEFVYETGTEHFQIKNLDTGKCLDVEGYRDNDERTSIQVYTCEAYNVLDTDQWWFQVPA